MESTHASTIRGLNIATVVISAFVAALLGFILAAIAMGGAVLDNPELRDDAALELEISADDAEVLEYLGISADDPMGIARLVLDIAGEYLSAAAICHVITLIIGIVGIRFSKNPDKLKTLFFWTIAGIIVALVGCNIVIVVLLIISAVLINKDRKEASLPPTGAHMAR